MITCAAYHCGLNPGGGDVAQFMDDSQIANESVRAAKRRIGQNSIKGSLQQDK